MCKQKDSDRPDNCQSSVAVVIRLREWVSKSLVKIATKIWPENPLVKEFHIQRMHDLNITGKHIVRLNFNEISKDV